MGELLSGWLQLFVLRGAAAVGLFPSLRLPVPDLEARRLWFSAV